MTYNETDEAMRGVRSGVIEIFWLRGRCTFYVRPTETAPVARVGEISREASKVRENRNR